MNIAFYGLKNSITEQLEKRNGVKVVRYADDFVVFTRNLEVKGTRDTFSKTYRA